MLKRLFALVVLLVLIGAGLYYWKLGGSIGAEDVGRALRDTATTGAVKAALGLNRNLEPYSIQVSTEERVVTLRGEVPREELKALAARVAAAVPDVRQVVNHMRVAPASSPPPPGRTLGESLDDRALEVKVRLAFSLRRELAGTDISVRAFRRHVTLAGEVRTEEQRRVAVEVARETAIVAGVADQLRVREDPRGRGAAVERALAANPNLARYALKVQEQGGRLVLKGRVRTGAEKDLAGLLARETAGGPVENALVVRP